MRDFIENIQYEVDCAMHRFNDRLSSKARVAIVLIMSGILLSAFICFVIDSIHY